MPETDHHLLIRLWDEGFKAHFGFKYLFSAADAAAVKRVLKVHTPEKVMEMAEAAWAVKSERPFWHCFHMSRSLLKFVAAINEIGAELAQMRPAEKVDYTKF